MTQTKATKLYVKGAIELLRESLAETDKKIKAVHAEMDKHGKLIACETSHSITLHAQRKQCLDTIDLLCKFAKSQGEEV